MKKIITSALFLCSSVLSADGLGVDLGPLNVGLGVNEGAYYNDGAYNRGYYDNNRGYYDNNYYNNNSYSDRGLNYYNGSSNYNRDSNEDDLWNDNESNGRGSWGRSMMDPREAASQICQAINNQSQVEIVVRTREIVNSKEARMEVRKVVIEPYALAVTKEGKPVLRGNVVSDKNIKEVTIKFDEDHFNTSNKKDEDSTRSSSWFSSSKDLELTKVVSVNLLNKRFDAPRDFKGFEDNSLNVICEIQQLVKK